MNRNEYVINKFAYLLACYVLEFFVVYLSVMAFKKEFVLVLQYSGSHFSDLRIRYLKQGKDSAF